MTELPSSDFMQNYYKEEGIAFTDSELATILWNTPLPLPKAEILEALREIADTTADASSASAMGIRPVLKRHISLCRAPLRLAILSAWLGIRVRQSYR